MYLYFGFLCTTRCFCGILCASQIKKKTHTDCEIDNSQMQLLSITLAYLEFLNVRE